MTRLSWSACEVRLLISDVKSFCLSLFVQKPGVPLSRGALIAHCYTDLSFMDFICSLVTRSIEVTSLTPPVTCRGPGEALGTPAQLPAFTALLLLCRHIPDIREVAPSSESSSLFTPPPSSPPWTPWTECPTPSSPSCCHTCRR